MHCVKKITDDLTWVGVNDRRLAMFEGVYSVPGGVSYNSYLLTDDKTVLFDTVDKAVRERFMENVSYALGGRGLDYLIVQHIEPDHSASVMEVLNLYKSAKLICNAKTLAFIKQFYDFNEDNRVITVKEGDTIETGAHTLTFLMAPMVHWPEVMVTYDKTNKILFSADAFGCFGALNGAMFADEVDFERDYMDEARRYYTNIVGKYGAQAAALLDKASAVAIDIICPLHGFVWREGLNTIISKYALWSAYEPEEKGVMIAYASVYGNTENAAEILSSRLREAGVKTEMYDVSVTPASEIIAAAFKLSHLVFASTTYNAGIFVTMEALIADLTAHNIKNRAIAIIENGSWAPTSGGLIRDKLSKRKGINFIGDNITINSGIKDDTLTQIEALADLLINDLRPQTEPVKTHGIDNAAMFKLSYGLFVLTARANNKDNGCIINTAVQITDNKKRVSIAVNKANYTHDIILKTGIFNISVLTIHTPFEIFERFGFKSGRNCDKFAGTGFDARTENGVLYIPVHTNAVIAAKVIASLDYDTHTLFIAEVTQALTLSDEPSVTYQYYFDNIKPKPQRPKDNKTGYVCKICGYVHEGDILPDDFICPLCKHGADDFEKLG